MKKDILNIDLLDAELNAVLDFWLNDTKDEVNGGFIGRIGGDGIRYNNAPKGSVLNARILWSFSAGYQYTKNEVYLQGASYAYEYFIQHFIDGDLGGVYWLLDAEGEPLDTKKQIYATAFAIYGLSEYYKISRLGSALDAAKKLFSDIEEHSFDHKRGGYLEAFSREWEEIDDLRLSDKDENQKKTMNTHLHILEAYANLYTVWPNARLYQQLKALVHLFLDHFIDNNTAHLKLFFNEEWESRSDLVSFGHDIEASWLLVEAARVLTDDELIKRTEAIAVKMAMAVVKAIDHNGGLWYEYEPSKQHWIKEKHWWVQAEAMVGFLNAWELSDNDFFYDKAVRIWTFIHSSIIDKERGEWFWGIDGYGDIMQEDKVGIWKCPYHNLRCLIEAGNRLKEAKTKMIL